MCRTVATGVALLMCARALASPAPNTDGDRLFHDTRLVSDIAAIRFDTESGDKGHSWVVIQVIPDSLSGTMVGPAGIMQGPKLVKPPAGSSALFKKASWKLLDRLSDDRTNIPSSGALSWMSPMKAYEKRKQTPADIYDVFVKGGVLLCRYSPEAQDSTRFDNAFLVPQAWAAKVKPAWEYYRKNAELFSGKMTERDVAGARKRLVALLDGDNPILSVLAFRQLLSIKQIDRQLLDKTVRSKDGTLRACLIYLATINHGQLTIKEDEWVKNVNMLVRSAKTSEELKPSALAAFAAVLFNPSDKVMHRCSRAFLSEAFKRYRILHARGAKDAYLDTIFKIMRLERPEDK